MQAFEVEGSSGAALQNAARERFEDLAGAPGRHPSPAEPAESCENLKSSFSEYKNKQRNMLVFAAARSDYIRSCCSPTVVAMTVGACLLLMAGRWFCDSDYSAPSGMKL